MEARNGMSSVPMGSKQSQMKRYFKRALHPLLSICSMEAICKAFPGYSEEEQKFLHRLFIKVIASLHGHVEEVFESLCDEMQVGTSLDVLEQLIEEQSLDILSDNKSNVLEAAQDLVSAKNNEIKSLLAELNAVEERNRAAHAQIESLKEGQKDFVTMLNAIEKERN